jgi:hypothetical protein
MCELNINLRPNENLYVTTYEDGEVTYKFSFGLKFIFNSHIFFSLFL